MFYGADTSALLEINRYLTINVATVGEFLSRAGELGRELYFVLSGEIHVLTASGQLDLQLFEGSVVGEVCLLFDMPSPHDAQVVQTATLFTLFEQDFYEIICKFPALLKRIEKRGLAVYRGKWEIWEREAAQMDACDDTDDSFVTDLTFARNGENGRKVRTKYSSTGSISAAGGSEGGEGGGGG